jgi:hypothetical protein
VTVKKMASSREVVGAMIALFIGAIFAGYILPPAISSIFNANTTGWDTGTASLWLVLGIIIVVAVVVIFLKTTGLL